MNILTFDIEDWFHTHENRQRYSGNIWNKLPSKVVANTGRILNMLDKHGLKATFFILGWVAKNYPELIKEIHSKGHEIAAHSYWHHNTHLIKHSDFEKDLKLSLNVIQDITGEKVRAYRTPGFNLTLKDSWAFEILAANGITVDSSVQIWRSTDVIPVSIASGTYKIMEFPLITSCFGFPYTGGGYFRAIPYSLLNYLFKQQDYHLLYFHPRDFDPENPTTNLFSFSRNQLNRLNTGKCMYRLEDILQQYKTCTLFDAAEIFLNKQGQNE